MLRVMKGSGPPKAEPTEKPVIGEPATEIKLIDPSLVSYRGPEARCQYCQHFEDGACDLVDGQIDPEGTCVLFESDGSGEPSIEEETTELSEDSSEDEDDTEDNDDEEV